MVFFRSMEIDPTCEFSSPQSAVRRNLFLCVLCISTFSRNQDPKRTLLGTPRLSARSPADAVLVAEVEEHGGRTPRFGK